MKIKTAIRIMASINLPKELLKEEVFKTLPAKEKEEYLTNLLKKILELNPDGVTISKIKDVTGLTYSTVWHHMEILSCTAQSHKLSHGNVDVYYPTGQSSHLNEHSNGKATFAVSMVENGEGKFVCIQEKRENRLGNQRVYSGICLPLELIDGFIDDINKIKK